MLSFVKESLLDATREQVFAFHQRPDAFALLLPPWEETRVIQPPSSLEVGTRVVVQAERGVPTQSVYVETEIYSYRTGKWYDGASGYMTATAVGASSIGSDVHLAGVARSRYFVRAAVWFWRNGVWAGPFYDTPQVYQQIETGYSNWRASYTCYV